MTLTVVWIAPLTGPVALEPDAVTELLRRHIALPDRVEHLRIRAGPTGFMIFGLLMAETPQQARVALRNLTQRALTNEPELRLWRVV